MSWPSSTKPLVWHIPLDFVVLSALVAVINAIFAPEDPGFVRVNPSPWLIVPILIGCRYGFGAGAITGAIIAVGIGFTADGPFASALSRHGYLFGSLIFMGGICGEIQARYRRTEVQLNAQKENSDARLRKLDSDLAILREGKAELERMLATRDSELATLDSDLRRLFDAEGDELFSSLLLLLNRHVRVSEGAIYWVENGRLVRKAILGQSALLPAEAALDQIQMAALAIKSNHCVTIPEFWKSATPDQTDYLLAAPFPDATGKTVGVLVVTAMPFISLNKKSIQLINLICRWSARILEARAGDADSFRSVEGLPDSKIFTLDFFRKNLELAHDSFSGYGLPASVVVFRLPAASAELQPAFEKKIAALLRAGDYAATFGWKSPHLVVLLPLTGERGASIFLNRIALNYSKSPLEGHALDARTLSFARGQSFEEFWSALHEGARNN